MTERMAAWVVAMGLASSVLGDCRHQYMSNSELGEYLTMTANLEPSLANVYSIGTTQNQELDILVLELSAADPSEELPNIKFIGGVHGDEAIGTQILMSFIEYLVDGYRREERMVTWILNNTRIHILPRLNLEGFELAGEGICILGPGRKNGAGYDLNRVFQLMEHPVAEAEAVKEWLKSKQFVLSAAVHAGELVVVYPPDDIIAQERQVVTSDEDVFKHIASVYARNHVTMLEGNGCNGNKNFKDGIVNGAAWYPVKGTMQDYNLMVGTMELNLQINCCKYPISDQICDIWEENKLALIKLTAEGCRGVRGRVTASGHPVSGAVVTVLGRNMTVKTNEQGYYFRILLPGKYFLKVESNGLMTLREFFVPRSDTAFLKWEVVNVELEAERMNQQSQDDVLSSNNSTEQPTSEKSMSYDRGGLDPDVTYTYESTPTPMPDSQLRLGESKGGVCRLSPDIYPYLLLFICTLCKYFISSDVPFMLHLD